MAERKLSILMLTWEFPPRIIGGISSHVNDLSLALARRGIEVHVVTCDFPGAPEYEQVQGVNGYRFNSKMPSYSFLQWVFSMNQNMAEKATDVINSQNENIDVIHAQDWLVADAATKVREAFDKPLVSTIHATEVGRRGGIHNEYQRTINEVERHLISQSSRVICCSSYMAHQVSQTFSVPQEKLRIIPNGVNVSKFSAETDTRTVKRRYARNNERIVLYVGRLVHEKGVHVLIGAAPKVLGGMPNVNFIIVGEGGMKEYLLKEAWDFGIGHRVFFTGFVDQKRLVSLYKASDVAVFPSLYEPFGITVLEAMAAKTPVVVTDTGGLSETVKHDITGVKAYADNSDSLAWGILRLLQNRAYAERIRENAYREVVKHYGWESITDQTIQVYWQAVRAAPIPSLKLDLGSVLFKIDQYPEQSRVLILLYVLGAVSIEHALSVRELATFLGMEAKQILKMLRLLISSGYVDSYKGTFRRLRYYVTKNGIIKACSLFS